MTSIIANAERKKIKLQIWDKAGIQDEFSNKFMNNAIGAVIVYDVTRPETFNNVKT